MMDFINRVDERIAKILPIVLAWGVPLILLCFFFGMGFWWALLTTFLFWVTFVVIATWIVESYKEKHR